MPPLPTLKALREAQPLLRPVWAHCSECDWDVGSAQCLPKPVDPNATHHEWGFGGDCDAVPAAPLGASIGTMVR